MSKIGNCSGCGVEILVDDDYEYEYCCSGSMASECGCMGRELNPVFCDLCDKKMAAYRVKTVDINGEYSE